MERLIGSTTPMRGLLFCPHCHKQHIDEGEFATRVHRTHRCVDDAAGKGCAFEWRVEMPPVFGVLSVNGTLPAYLSPLDKRCADKLADEVELLVRTKIVDSRSSAADALLDYRDPRRKKDTRRALSAAVFVFSVVNNVARVFLIEHKLLGLWLPPGGEFQSNETPLEAAKRELREETGFEEPRITFPEMSGVVDGMPAGFFAYEEHDAGPKGLHLNFNFAAMAIELPEPVGDGSWKSYQWCTRDQLVELHLAKKAGRNVLQLADKVFRGL